MSPRIFCILRKNYKIESCLNQLRTKSMILFRYFFKEIENLPLKLKTIYIYMFNKYF